jgi:hypothetical protein
MSMNPARVRVAHTLGDGTGPPSPARHPTVILTASTTSPR